MARLGLVAIALAIASLPAGVAHAGFDLSYDVLYVKTFVEDQLVTFDGLLPGTVLEPGDAIAPGVQFSAGAGSDADARALVVDVGGGDRVLRSIDLGTPGSPQQSRIVFAFGSDVITAGVMANAPGTLFINPQSNIYEASLDILGFASIGGSVVSFFGWRGDETSTPIRYLEYRYAGDQPATPFEVDDLAIVHVPEPGASIASAAATLALAALLARPGRRVLTDRSSA
jgi:hypothetical protein